jgi:hypothetical protein
VGREELDSLTSACIFAAKDALLGSPPLQGLSDLELNQLAAQLENLLHSHASIRLLLKGKQNPSAVDASTIARLQLEVLYSLCFLLESAENVRLFLKNGWKKKYIRFLLHREEYVNLHRFDEYFNKSGIETLEKLQRMCGVTEDERRTIDVEQLGPLFGPQLPFVHIADFPLPGRIIRSIKDSNQKAMLKRLYPEYQYLCSFAHADSEAAIFRALSDPNSTVRKFVTTGQIEDFYQKQILEMPVLYSALSSIQAATEVAAFYPANVDLRGKLAKAWTRLIQVSLHTAPLYEIRAKGVLGIL